jgi:hypothetical protein
MGMVAIVDMAGVLWGPIGREFVGVMFVIAFVFCTGLVLFPLLKLLDFSEEPRILKPFREPLSC